MLQGHGDYVSFRNIKIRTWQCTHIISEIQNPEINDPPTGRNGLERLRRSLSASGGITAGPDILENDNSTSHNLVENITGSVVCYDNRIDVNTRGGTNCNIKVYHPVGERGPVLDDKSTGNNTTTVTGFSCKDPYDKWCQYKYCGAATPTLPDAPSGLTANPASYSQIGLSWTDNAVDEDGFIIERKSSGLFYVVATLQANAALFSDAGLTELTAYTYRVAAYNVGGFSGYSNEISAVTGADSDTCLSTAEAGIDLSPRIYPNPFLSNTQIQYTVPSAGQVTLCIYDMSGREVGVLVNERKQTGTYTLVFNADKLHGGNYYCTIKTEDMIMTEKFVLLQ